MSSERPGSVLVFQHHPDEGPGALGSVLIDAGMDLHIVEVDQGDDIGDLAAHDYLLVMGGPMDVWQQDEHPWLVGEKAAIRYWVRELNRPYLGVCLGHQLLADALGGAVGPMERAEIGVVDIALSAEGRADPVFAKLGAAIPGLQWHHAEVLELPEDSMVLASNANCAVQALRVGARAWGVQFHVEVDTDTIDAWAAVPEYEEVLRHSGHHDPDWLHRAVARNLDVMRTATATLARGFLRSGAASAARP